MEVLKAQPKILISNHETHSVSVWEASYLYMINLSCRRALTHYAVHYAVHRNHSSKNFVNPKKGQQSRMAIRYGTVEY